VRLCTCMRWPEMREDTATIVVPTYRRPQAVALTLDALLRLDYPAGKLQVIVIDDSGGDPGTEQVVRARQGGPVDLQLVVRRNGGAAAARNHGARLASGKMLLFCDDDIIVAADHLRRHLETHERFDADCVGGYRRFPPNVEDQMRGTPFGRYWLDVVQDWASILDSRGAGPSDCVLGGECVLARDLASYDLSVSADLFERLGGFDERFPGGTLEDYEFCLRAAAAGCRLVRNNGIAVWHNDPTIRLDTACRREALRARAAVLLAAKHPDFTPPVVTSSRINERSDGVRIRAKKIIKHLLSRPGTFRAIQLVTMMVERLTIRDVGLRPLYRSLIALSIYRGVESA